MTTIISVPDFAQNVWVCVVDVKKLDNIMADVLISLGSWIRFLRISEQFRRMHDFWKYSELEQTSKQWI